MSDRLRIDTSNIKVLEDFYNNLAANDKRGIIIRALRKAVKPLIDKAKATAPVGKNWVGKKAVMGKFGGFHVGGGLRDSFGTMEIKNEIAIYAGAMRPKGAHGHLIEDGTGERGYRSGMGKRGGSGVWHRTGSIKGSGFFSNAVDATKDQVYNSLKSDWHDMIVKEINKMAPKLK
jgi:hypothetical protein